MRPEGLILIDKPQGLTSRKVTNLVSKICREKRAGHLGTLDPLATGLLPVLIGRATRLAPFLESDEKEYLAKIKLGAATDTMDSEGQVSFTAQVPQFDRDKILSVLKKFEGEIEQKPPIYSALKVKGKRLYELARKGEKIETSPRKVKIFEINLENLGPDSIEILVRCSPGTYIRTLADEIGKLLGCGAHLSGLRRLKNGRFSVDNSVELSKLTPENYSDYLIQLTDVLDFQKIELTDEDGYRIKDGITVPLESLDLRNHAPGRLFRVFSKPCFSICEISVKDGQPFLKPLKVFRVDET